MDYILTCTNQDIALAHSKALTLWNHITAHSTNAVLWLKANLKPYANQQRLPKTTWEVILENIQKPIIVPAIVIYWLCFTVFLSMIYCGYHMWGNHGEAIKAWFSRAYVKIQAGFSVVHEQSTASSTSWTGSFQDVVGKVGSADKFGTFKHRKIPKEPVENWDDDWVPVYKRSGWSFRRKTC